VSYEAVVPSNRRAKDREADHQRWADRQEVTADVLRETVEAAGARAAEISEWLDSSFLPEDPDSVFGATAKPAPVVTVDRLKTTNPADEPPLPRETVVPEPLPSGTSP
jgi:hypothetical protein